MSKNKNTDKIIKEFLFHSLSNEQLDVLKHYFSDKVNNYDFDKKTNILKSLEVKTNLFQSTCPLGDDALTHLADLKKYHKSFVLFGQGREGYKSRILFPLG